MTLGTDSLRGEDCSVPPNQPPSPQPRAANRKNGEIISLGVSQRGGKKKLHRDINEENEANGCGRANGKDPTGMVEDGGRWRREGKRCKGEVNGVSAFDRRAPPSSVNIGVSSGGAAEEGGRGRGCRY